MPPPAAPPPPKPAAAPVAAPAAAEAAPSEGASAGAARELLPDEKREAELRSLMLARLAKRKEEDRRREEDKRGKFRDEHEAAIRRPPPERRDEIPRQRRGLAKGEGFDRSLGRYGAGKVWTAPEPSNNRSNPDRCPW